MAREVAIIDAGIMGSVVATRLLDRGRRISCRMLSTPS